jgi:hydroxymethylpyrimidine pyrophosphatase-like HAD family hydrolase
MSLPIQLISTDFDGTLFAEFESPPVPPALQALLAALQTRGAKWVINTGRDLSSLLEALGRARVGVHPDYLALVEREIYVREGHRYVPLEPWNSECDRMNAELFGRVRKDLPRLRSWLNERFDVTLYEDAWSPLCLIAENNADAEAAVAYLAEYAAGVPDLTVVRNDVYARFSHGDYNKGTALAEIARRLGLGPEVTFAAGDHWNDLPMLRREHARFIAAPANAVPEVKAQVEEHGGYLSSQHCGHGVTRSLEYFLEQHGALAGL